MHTDSTRHDVTIHAPVPEVLAAIRDVAGQVRWAPAITEAEVLETTSDGLPRRARFAASTAIGTDHYTLEYEHDADGLRWIMAVGGLQTGQEGHYTVRAKDPGSADETAVTLELTIHHNLPLPGFVRRRVIDGLVKGTLEGLKADLEHRD